MKFYWNCNWRVLWAGVLLFFIFGCAHKTFDPPKTDEIPKGPGVFSKGDDGVVLFDSRKEQTKVTAKPQVEQKDTRAVDKTMTDADFEEFEAFRQWQEWKKSNADSDEYRSFKQWKEWRQYQDWKKRK